MTVRELAITVNSDERPWNVKMARDILSRLAKIGYCIAVDFDGTLCYDCFPRIGGPTYLLKYVKVLQEAGIDTILWTCRTGEPLNEAVAWCKDHGLNFTTVNENTPRMIQRFGNDPRKVGADEYWDDKACNIVGGPIHIDSLVFPWDGNGGGKSL